jgi:hypothetical protein
MSNVAALVDGSLRKWNRAGWMLSAASVLSALGFLGIGEGAWAEALGWFAAPGSLVSILVMRFALHAGAFLLFGVCFAVNVIFWYAFLTGGVKLGHHFWRRRIAGR